MSKWSPKVRRIARLKTRLDRAMTTALDMDNPRSVRVKAARLAANWAEQLGMLRRPRGCERCRRRLKLERHHPDHRIPLWVRFLCRRCHRDADAQRSQSA